MTVEFTDIFIRLEIIYVPSTESTRMKMHAKLIPKLLILFSTVLMEPVNNIELIGQNLLCLRQIEYTSEF